ncbi:unnamed protein product, partial [Staurois parvus]
MDPFMETNTYNVSTAVWKDSPRTVINSLFLTVLLTFPSIQRLKTAVWRECHRTVRNRLFMTVLGLSFHTAIHFFRLGNYSYFHPIFFFLLLLLHPHPHPLLLL